MATEIVSFRCFEESTATLSLEVSNYLQLKGAGVGSFIRSPVFKVGGYDWEIRFHPAGGHNEPDGYASCYLRHLNPTDEDVSTMVTLSMLEKNGREQVASYNVSKRVFSSWNYNQFSWGYPKFVDKARLESLSQHGDGCFTIVCFLTVTNESQQPPLDLPGHLEHMLRDERGMDVTFNVGGQVYHAHRFVLAARSPVFMVLLFGSMAEKDMRFIDIADMEPFIFKLMLHFIYVDSLLQCEDKGGYSSAVMHHLLVAADRYGLDRLKMICEKDLCKTIDVKTITTTLELAEQRRCERLKAACQNFVSNGRRRLRPRA